MKAWNLSGYIAFYPKHSPGKQPSKFCAISPGTYPTQVSGAALTVRLCHAYHVSTHGRSRGVQSDDFEHGVGCDKILRWRGTGIASKLGCRPACRSVDNILSAMSLSRRPSRRAAAEVSKSTPQYIHARACLNAGL